MANIIRTIFVPEEQIKRSSRSKNILILEEKKWKNAMNLY